MIFEVSVRQIVRDVAKQSERQGEQRHQTDGVFVALQKGARESRPHLGGDGSQKPNATKPARKTLTAVVSAVNSPSRQKA